MKKKSIETLAVHAGEPREKVCGAVTLPIFQSSTYQYEGESSYESLRYIRLNNTPNHQALGAKLAALEGAEAGLAVSSGMAAISDSILAFLRSGDHLLVQNCIYGGTRDLITRELPRLGIESDFIEDLSAETLEKHLRDNTRMLYVESITNPLMQIGNLLEAAEFARRKGLISLIDNTFPTPCNFRPIEIGFDVVLHSATKYLNGHSDIVAGAVVGKQEFVGKICSRNLHFGGTLDPHACFLLQRGMKTLPLRMKQHNLNASSLARFLADHPKVSRVYYPGLPDSGSNDASSRLFAGFGGMLSMELKGGPEVTGRFISRLELPVDAPSLGGVESLVVRPSRTSHAGLTPEERSGMGISDNLIRISTGIENTGDLVEDFGQALDYA